MLLNQFRPWGRMDWLVPKIPVERWDFIGCLSTEARSIASWRHLSRVGLLGRSRWLEIFDTIPTDQQLIDLLLQERRAQLQALGGVAADISQYELESIPERCIDDSTQYIAESGDSIVLDISSLPKRFFFALTKELLRTDSIRNLLVTYAIPARYPNRPLVSNVGVLTHLPMFGPLGLKEHQQPSKNVIIGVGFESMGLPTQLRDHFANDEISVLFPFPAGNHLTNRNWEVVLELQDTISSNPLAPYFVNSRDASAVFDLLCHRIRRPGASMVLAPYGPKSMSLGMCLAAIATGAEVIYTQPQSYDPEYSIGISQKNGAEEIYAYAVKLAGSPLYEL